MRWNAVKPDLSVFGLNDLIHNFSVQHVLLFLLSEDKFWVCCQSGCWDKIYKHLSSSRKELGGLILGKIYQVTGSEKMLISFEDIVPSESYENSSVSLKMDSDIWNHARSHLSGGTAVVGWYHSHPNLGAFFSGTDRYNQKAIFTAEFHVGLVVDPIRKERAFYRGPNSEEIMESNFVMMPVELGDPEKARTLPGSVMRDRRQPVARMVPLMADGRRAIWNLVNPIEFLTSRAGKWVSLGFLKVRFYLQCCRQRTLSVKRHVTATADETGEDASVTTRTELSLQRSAEPTNKNEKGRKKLKKWRDVT